MEYLVWTEYLFHTISEPEHCFNAFLFNDRGSQIIFFPKKLEPGNLFIKSSYPPPPSKLNGRPVRGPLDHGYIKI